MQISNPMAGRIRQLDGLRAIAILAVFLNHSNAVKLLWVGVDIFFVLSGFLITTILLERKRSRRSYFGYFYTRRAFRILPPYVLSLLGAALVYGPQFLKHWPYFTFFGMNLYEVIHPGIMPVPYWSLAVEEQFYFIWPLLILFCSERWVLRLSLLGIVLTPFIRLAGVGLHLQQPTIYFLTPFRADLLCAGALLACLWRHHGARTAAWGQRHAQWLCVGGFGALLALQVFVPFRLSSNAWEANVFLYSLSVAGSFGLVLWALVDRGALYKLLTTRVLQFLGKISYTFYLVHLLFLDLMRRTHPNGVYTSVVALILTVAFSAASWHLMERPLIAFAARLAPGGPPLPDPLPAQQVIA